MLKSRDSLVTVLPFFEVMKPAVEQMSRENLKLYRIDGSQYSKYCMIT